MNARKIFLNFLILFSAFQICFSQNADKIQPFDETEETNCCNFSGKMSNILEAIRSDSSKTAYIVIYGDKNNLRKNLYYEFLVKGNIKLRRLDENRIKFIRGKESEKFLVQFWLVPKDTAIEFDESTSWNFSFPIEKLFNFAEEFSDAIGCGVAGFEDAFLQILKANPNLRGNLVIEAKSRKKFYEKKKELAAFLSPIDRSRLKFFYVNSEYDYVEYWLVPKKK